MKSIELLMQLAKNPFYKLTDEEQNALDQALSSGPRVSSVGEDNKKKEAQTARGNAAVKEVGKLQKHATDPVSE